jgi:hypothetical protein
MRNLQNCRVFNHSAPISLNNATSAITNVIDTVSMNGGDLAVIVTLGATAGNFSALKVQESDDNSSYSDVTGCVVATSLDIDGGATDLPDGTGDDAGTYLFHIPLTASRKRYFKVVATEDNTGATLFSVVAIVTPNASGAAFSNAGQADASPADNCVLRAT